MTNPAKLSRPLTADEVAEFAPPRDDATESPTTSLIDLRSQSTAEAHFPGIAPSPKSAAADDSVPDPTPHKEN